MRIRLRLATASIVVTPARATMARERQTPELISGWERSNPGDGGR